MESAESQASGLGSRSDARVLVAVLAAAFSLRIGIVEVGPVIEDIRRDTGMSSGLAGILTMIPFTCMGAFAFLGPPLVQACGSARVVVAGLALLAGGSALRGLAGGAWLVLASTVPIGLGIALIGVTLPAIVKARFPRRPGAVTGAYVASASVGIALVGFGLVPLATALGGWRPAFLLTAVPPLLAIGFWVGSRGGALRPGLPVRLRIGRPGRTALLLGLVFGLQSTCFSGTVSWSPTIYEEAGWTQSGAAITTTSLGLGTIVSALIFPTLTDGRDRRPWIAAAAIAMAVATAGEGVAAAELGWLWLIMFGIFNGAVIALMLALPLDIGRDPFEVAGLAAWMFGIGYLLSGTAPILVGALRDEVGGFELPMALLAACGAIAGLLVLRAPKPRSFRHPGRRPPDAPDLGVPAAGIANPALESPGIDSSETS